MGGRPARRCQDLGCLEGAWRPRRQPCSRALPARVDTRENSYNSYIQHRCTSPSLSTATIRKSKSEAQWLSVQSLLGDCDGRPLFIVRSVFTSDCLLSTPSPPPRPPAFTNQTFQIFLGGWGATTSQNGPLQLSTACNAFIIRFFRSNIFFVRKPQSRFYFSVSFSVFPGLNK